VIRSDQHPSTDLLDVAHDIQAIALKNPVVDWGWFQQGYGPEPFDGSTILESAGTGTFAAVEHASYIVHHNGPQYFGYLGDNAAIVGTAATGTTTPSTPANGKMHGLQQFFTDINANNLNAAGGVYYIRGGYYNNQNLMPIDPNAAVQNSFPGNDDHGAYSDSQISEAMVADALTQGVKMSVSVQRQERDIKRQALATEDATGDASAQRRQDG
jgi:phospholipase C